MKSILKRNIQRDIDNSRFVSHFFPIILTFLFERYIARSEKKLFTYYLHYYFTSSGNFTDGLFRYSYLCCHILPFFGLMFYLTPAFIDKNWLLALSTFAGCLANFIIATYASIIERTASYGQKLNLAMALALNTIFTVLIVAYLSLQAYTLHYYIWLYMVLVGFTIVLNFTRGLINSIIAALIPFILDVRHGHGVDISTFIASFGLVSVYLLASVCKYVADTYARKSEKNEKISKSLLQHIPQGILRISADGTIDDHYSAQLTSIMGESKISGRTFKHVVLDRADMSENQRDQIWQSILASVGEDQLNLVLNAGNLPSEIKLHGPRDISLKCTWNAEIDDSNIVRRILVTLLDISAEIEAQKKFEEKNQEFNMVRELIGIGAKKSYQFFTSGRQLFNEMLELLEADEIDIESVKILFINIHTLKGAARTLHLMNMAEIFHKVECYYSDILRALAVIDSQRLVNILRQSIEVFDHYERVNRDIIGRTEEDGKVIIERGFLEESLKILNHIEVSRTTDLNLREMINDNRDQLIKLIFMSLPQVLDDIMKQAPRIASDLGKYDPVIAIDMEDILISHRQEAALKKAFIHVLRNALDHGIEFPEIRKQKGKAPHGLIVVEATTRDERIVVRCFDDGAGLAVGRLRQKGLELRLIDREAKTEAVAELIFHQGMSTAKSLSQVSGRGIGMNAIRRFVEAEGGSVGIELGECLDRQNELYQFQIVIILPTQGPKPIDSSAGTCSEGAVA